MGFRFRRSARLGPLRFHFANSGLSSISVGGRGASLSIPVARRGGVRTTVGLPGTGLSWSVDLPAEPHAGHGSSASRSRAPLPNSRRLRPAQLDALKQQLISMMLQQAFGAGSNGALLWDLGLISRLVCDGSLGARVIGQLTVIETPEALEGYLLRAQSQADAKRRAQRCLTALELALQLAGVRGWLPQGVPLFPPPPAESAR